MRKILVCMAAALVVTSVACTRKNNLYPVSGKVLYQGSPAAGANVFFRRKGGDTMNDHMIMGVVQEDGSFDLVCGSLGKGAPSGDYDVLIEWKQVSGQSKGRPQHGGDLLKGHYADPKNPLFQATVEDRTTELAPFDVTN